MAIKLLLILLIALAIFFLVWRLTGSKSKGAANSDGLADATDEAFLAEQVVEVPQKNSIASVGDLPVWCEFDPTNPNPDIYESVYWEVEPFGEYIYYLAGDYKKGDRGHLLHSTPSTVFSVLTSFEPDSIEANKHDYGYDQQAAEHSPVNIDDYMDKSVGDVMDLFKDKLGEDLSNKQYVSLMPLMPAGALGNARLLVGKNWISVDGGVKLSMIYDEFRTPASTDERARMVWMEAHAMNREQSLEVLVSHFVTLVDRYKNMPYLPLSGATRY